MGLSACSYGSDLLDWEWKTRTSTWGVIEKLALFRQAAPLFRILPNLVLQDKPGTKSFSSHSITMSELD